MPQIYDDIQVGAGMDRRSPSGIKIVVVDDHAAVRYLVRRVLHRPPDWELVGEAGDGVVAVELVKQLQPDIVIMDVQMPRLDGIEATKRIASSVPQSIVIGFSTYTDPFTRAAMREAGSAAFVAKEEISKLPQVIEQVIRLPLHSTAEHSVDT